MNNPIGYAINFAKSKSPDLDEGARKTHTLSLKMAEEDLDRYEEIEKLAMEFVSAKEHGFNFIHKYRRLAEILGIDA